MSSLKDRLQALRRGAEKDKQFPANASPRASAGEKRSAGLPPETQGWKKISDYVFRRDSVFPLPAETLRELSLAAFFFPGSKPENLLWYDTETTGLSGGAGTHIFLYGSARVRGNELHLSQFFLADFPGEKDFLSALRENFAAASFSDSPFMLSYNGKTFDAPLLRGRFIVNRMPCELPAQFDLLFTSRRLWKNILPDCSLGTVEKYILRKERTGDIPGALIPQVYFDYLAGRRTDMMANVVSHHREDILSLALLFARFGRIVENPEETLAAGSVNAAALGILIEAVRPGSGIPVLRAAALNGDTRSLEWLSRRYKRTGAFTEALNLWTALAGKNAFAALELAKHNEHRSKNYKEALRLTQKLLAEAGKKKTAVPGLDAAALKKRQKRLLGKIENSG